MSVLVGLLLVCAAWAVAASVLIARDLESRGVSVRAIWLRLTILRFVHQYYEVTREETGRAGPLFYHYVVPLNVALVLVVLMGIVAPS